MTEKPQSQYLPRIYIRYALINRHAEAGTHNRHWLCYTSSHLSETHFSFL